MNAKETILDSLLTSLQSYFENDATYKIASRKIKRFRENVFDVSKADTPSVNVIDVGESIPEVRDAVNTQYLLTVNIYALVKTESKGAMLEGINDVISDIQKFCDTNPTIAVDLKLRSVESVNYPDKNMADAAITLHVRYLRQNGGV